MFISIRWKAALLLSLILLILILGWVSRSVYLDLENYRASIQAKQLQHQETLNQLINDNFEKLSQYAQLIVDYPFIRNLNQTSDLRASQTQLEAKWFDLNLNIGIDYISINDEQGLSLIGAQLFNDKNTKPKLESSLRLFTNDNLNSARSFVFCDKHCSQVTVEPFFFDNGEKGQLVISQNMSELVARYYNISGSSFAILIEGPKNDGELFYIEQWGGKLWAASNFENTSQLLLAYSKQHFDIENAYQQADFSDVMEQDYVVNKLVPRKYVQAGNPAIYLSIVDHEEQKSVLRQNVLNQFMVGLFAWLLAVSLLLLALLGPIRRILTLTKVMSFLPEKKFSLAKQSMDYQPTFIYDELTQLESSTLMMTNKLEDLEHQVTISEAALKNQILTVTRSKDFLQRLFDNANLFILTLGKSNSISQSNAFFGQFFNANIIDSFIELMVDDDDQMRYSQYCSELFAGEIESFQQECWMKAEQKNILVAWTHTLVKNEFGDRQVLSIGIDVTQQKHDEKQLQWLADNDPLTKIGNRRAFQNGLDRLLAEETRGAVIFIDVNRFKQINDIYGHNSGDRVLIEIADKLKSYVRGGDLVCRLAGDEFTLILPGVKAKALQNILPDLAHSLRDTIMLEDGRKIDYSASLGAALYPDHGDDKQTLIVHSDMAMYQAKKKGFNYWHIFDYGDDSLHALKREHEITSWIRKALEEDAFKLVFQPIMSIDDLQVSHYEVLLRLDEKNGKPISPGIFIPIAERVGMIQEIDNWVVKNLFAKIKQEQWDEKSDLTFSINISAPSLQDTYFANKLYNMSTRLGVDPSIIIIELTETAYIDNFEQVYKSLNFLHEQGFKIALDDFGVGFSSFSYMQRLPLSYVKLDGLYIKDLPENEKNRAFIESVVIMAQAFGMMTIAEFVENKAILDVLQDIGVDYAQGYAVGKPSATFMTDENIAQLAVTLRN